MKRNILKLTKKIDELQKQINYQNECIMDQSMIIHKLIEKLVIIPTYPSTPSIDPHFGKDIPYVPYKGPDCADGFVNVVTTGTEITYIRDENSICGGAKVTNL
jgi:hypothetical protein